MRNNSFSTFATTTAVVVTAACFVLLLPSVRAFISTHHTTRHNTQHKLSTEPNTSNDDDQQQCEEEHRHRPNGMPILPSNVVQYTQVPKTPSKFTATTIPSGLKKQHNTKKGTWGIIRVSKGQLEYTIIEPHKSVHVLDGDSGNGNDNNKDHDTNSLGVIEPRMLHQVKALSDDVEFVVEFWRVPGTGVVDEKREGLN
eukprot:244411_1